LFKKKNKKLQFALPPFWRIFYVFRRFYIRTYMRHREALVFFTGTRGTFPEILFALIKSELFSAIKTNIFARADFLSCVVRFLFGQMIHQNFHAR
jgi:hypothetical protein